MNDSSLPHQLMGCLMPVAHATPGIAYRLTPPSPQTHFLAQPSQCPAPDTSISERSVRACLARLHLHKPIDRGPNCK